MIYIEACESGSMFEGILKKNLNIYAVTAANSKESSFGAYCSESYPSSASEYGTCLGDVFSISWLEDRYCKQKYSNFMDYFQLYDLFLRLTFLGQFFSVLCFWGQ